MSASLIRPKKAVLPVSPELRTIGAAPRVTHLSNDQDFDSLKRKAADCFRYRAFADCALSSEAALVIQPTDAFLNYYYSMSLFELGRRDEALDRLRFAVRKSPEVILAAASGHYFTRRRRTVEGYRHEDGWITMLEVVIEAGLLPVYNLDGLAKFSKHSAVIPLPLSIPKQIFQFWDKSVIPNEVLELSSRTQAVNSDLKYELFSEQDARDFLHASLGNSALPLFDACPHVAAKADFFRAAYLLEHGGVYIDADEVCTQPLWPVLSLDHFDLVISYTKASTSCINNWFIAAAPKHSLVAKVTDYIMQNLWKVQKYGLDTSVWVVTGPGVWTFAALDLGLDPLSYGSAAPFGKACVLEEKCYRKIFHSPPMLYKNSVEGNWRL